MRYIALLFVIVLLIHSAFIPPAAADTRYVGDQLIITLRQGKSTKHKILKTLKTGTPLEILEEDESYYKVRTTDGLVGYVLRQYVSSSPPKSQRIQELEQLNNSLQERINTLEEANSTLEMEIKNIQEKYQQDFSGLSTKSSSLEQSLEQALNNERVMAEKYDILSAQAENVVEIVAERDKLSEQNKKLETEVRTLLQKSDKLSDSRMIKWFLAGGGVFFFGWIIGKISRKKRSRF
ncbi:MAG: TIGR04211 family SH3 domain-containing protein [Desulfobulbales bacterium]|nr:TIGR04211 family SH3 domain-containing protein [Desulfobulbales bacterium]